MNVLKMDGGSTESVILICLLPRDREDIKQWKDFSIDKETLLNEIMFIKLIQRLIFKEQ